MKFNRFVVGSTTLEIPKISYNGRILQGTQELERLGLSRELIASARNSFLIQDFKIDTIIPVKKLVEEIRIENEISNVRNGVRAIFDKGDIPNFRSIEYKYEDCLREQFFNNKINKKIRSNRQTYYKEMLNLTRSRELE